MENSTNWTEQQWSIKLFEYTFLEGNDTQGLDVVRIPHDELFKSCEKERNQSALEVEKQFLEDCFLKPIKDAQNVKDWFRNKLKFAVNSEETEKHYSLLVLSLLAASAEHDTYKLGDYRKRFAAILGIEENSIDINREGLPRLWQNLQRRIYQKSTNEPSIKYRHLELPDYGRENIIGYSKKLSFPSYRDSIKFAQLVHGDDTNKDLTVLTPHELFKLLYSKKREFTATFVEELEIFRVSLFEFDDPTSSIMWNFYVEICSKVDPNFVLKVKRLANELKDRLRARLIVDGRFSSIEIISNDENLVTNFKMFKEHEQISGRAGVDHDWEVDGWDLPEGYRFLLNGPEDHGENSKYWYQFIETYFEAKHRFESSFAYLIDEDDLKKDENFDLKVLKSSFSDGLFIFTRNKSNELLNVNECAPDDGDVYVLGLPAHTEPLITVLPDECKIISTQGPDNGLPSNPDGWKLVEFHSQILKSKLVQLPESDLNSIKLRKWFKTRKHKPVFQFINKLAHLGDTFVSSQFPLQIRNDNEFKLQITDDFHVETLTDEQKKTYGNVEFVFIKENFPLLKSHTATFKSTYKNKLQKIELNLTSSCKFEPKVFNRTCEKTLFYSEKGALTEVVGGIEQLYGKFHDSRDLQEINHASFKLSHANNAECKNIVSVSESFIDNDYSWLLETLCFRYQNKKQLSYSELKKIVSFYFPSNDRNVIQSLTLNSVLEVVKKGNHPAEYFALKQPTVFNDENGDLRIIGALTHSERRLLYAKYPNRCSVPAIESSGVFGVTIINNLKSEEAKEDADKDNIELFKRSKFSDLNKLDFDPCTDFSQSLDFISKFKTNPDLFEMFCLKTYKWIEFELGVDGTLLLKDMKSNSTTRYYVVDANKLSCVYADYNRAKCFYLYFRLNDIFVSVDGDGIACIKTGAPYSLFVLQSLGWYCLGEGHGVNGYYGSPEDPNSESGILYGLSSMESLYSTNPAMVVVEDVVPHEIKIVYENGVLKEPYAGVFTVHLPDGYKYEWKLNNDRQEVSTSIISVSDLREGSYELEVVASNAFEKYVGRLDFEVKADLPDPVFSQNVYEGEVPLRVTFKNETEGTYDAIKWLINGEEVDEVNEFDYEFKEPGKYIVELVIFRNDESASLENVTNVHGPLPVFSVDCDIDKTVVPFEVQFNCNVQGAYNSIEWTFGDDEPLFGELVRKTFEVAGKHFVSVKVENENGVTESKNAFEINAKKYAEYPVINYQNLGSGRYRFSLDYDYIPDEVIWETLCSQNSDQLAPTFNFKQEGWTTITALIGCSRLREGVVEISCDLNVEGIKEYREDQKRKKRKSNRKPGMKNSVLKLSIARITGELTRLFLKLIGKR